jgi:hypothetical protein
LSSVQQKLCDEVAKLHPSISMQPMHGHSQVWHGTALSMQVNMRSSKKLHACSYDEVQIMMRQLSGAVGHAIMPCHGISA